MPEPFVTAEPMLAIAEVVDRLERAWFTAESDDDSGLYSYISWRLDEFVGALVVAQREALGRRYLEVGCGIGTKLALAGLLGWEARGIEVRPQYVAAARHLAHAEIEIADARAYAQYHAFDVVYSYRPIISVEGQELFERHLTASMRSGSLLISPQRPMPPPWSFVAPNVWRR